MNTIYLNQKLEKLSMKRILSILFLFLYLFSSVHAADSDMNCDDSDPNAVIKCEESNNFFAQMDEFFGTIENALKWGILFCFLISLIVRAFASFYPSIVPAVNMGMLFLLIGTIFFWTFPMILNWVFDLQDIISKTFFG